MQVSKGGKQPIILPSYDVHNQNNDKSRSEIWHTYSSGDQGLYNWTQGPYNRSAVMLGTGKPSQQSGVCEITDYGREPIAVTLPNHIVPNFILNSYPYTHPSPKK